MDAVADRAGVARMTVYNQFRSRAGLLEALSDHLAERGGIRTIRGAFLEPDPPKALRRLVETFVGFWASDTVTLRRLRAMGIVAPGRDAAPRERDELRRGAVRTLLEKFDPELAHVDAGRREELVDYLTMLTSFETYDALASPKRSPDGIAETLTKRALQAIRETSPDRPRGRRSAGRISGRSGADGSGTPGSP